MAGGTALSAGEFVDRVRELVSRGEYARAVSFVAEWSGRVNGEFSERQKSELDVLMEHANLGASVRSSESPGGTDTLQLLRDAVARTAKWSCEGTAWRLPEFETRATEHLVALLRRYGSVVHSAPGDVEGIFFERPDCAVFLQVKTAPRNGKERIRERILRALETFERTMVHTDFPATRGALVWLAYPMREDPPFRSEWREILAAMLERQPATERVARCELDTPNEALYAGLTWIVPESDSSSVRMASGTRSASA